MKQFCREQDQIKHMKVRTVASHPVRSSVVIRFLVKILRVEPNTLSLHVLFLYVFLVQKNDDKKGRVSVPLGTMNTITKR